MSRSNPNAERQPNPSERWLEWKGSKATFEFYDKTEKKAYSIKCPFTFIVLDQLATIRGYNKARGDGIYSNEVRDTRAEIMVVKYFGGQMIAEGFYTAIKDKILAQRGHFVTNCYIAFKDGDGLKLGCIQFQGCSLGPWFEFVKNNREAIYKKAVSVKPGKLETSGNVQFYPPIFSIVELSAESDEKAKQVDKKLQDFLTAYLNRTKSEQVASPPSGGSIGAPNPEEDGRVPSDAEAEALGAGDEATNIPF